MNEFNKNMNRKEFVSLLLIEIRTEPLDVYFRADYTGGRLHFSGHDLGDTVEEIWGDDEYEYSYSLDEENSEKFWQVIKAEYGKEDEALLKLFEGEIDELKFRKILDDNDIKYEFWSYVSEI